MCIKRLVIVERTLEKFLLVPLCRVIGCLKTDSQARKRHIILLYYPFLLASRMSAYMQAPTCACSCFKYEKLEIPVNFLHYTTLNLP